jgi:hypothetical protein
MASQLNLDVLVSDYKPIPGDPAVMSEGRATWPTTSLSLLTGDRDAVLIDALAARVSGHERPRGRDQQRSRRSPPTASSRRSNTSRTRTTR